MEPVLLILAIAFGPSLLVFALGCVMALYRTHYPFGRRPYRVRTRDPRAT